MIKSIAEILLDTGAVNLNFKQPFTYASGIKSPIYCDNRILISNPQARRTVINAFVRMIKLDYPEAQVIAGTATAGIPWAAWIAEALNLPLVYVRGSAKNHGRQNQVEGQVLPSQKVILIEDLISTGSSSLEALQALRTVKADVLSCLSIFSYGMSVAAEAFKQADLSYQSLSSFDELMAVALLEKKMTKEDQILLRDWQEDPKGWGGRHGFGV